MLLFVLLLQLIQSFILLDEPKKSLFFPGPLHLLLLRPCHRFPLLILIETIEVALSSHGRFKSGLVISDAETSSCSLALLRHYELSLHHGDLQQLATVVS